MENKKYIKNILFGISLLPYFIVIYMCICYAFGGYRMPGDEEIIYGFDAIGILIKNILFIWFITFASFPYSLPIILIISVWIGYQIYYFITFKKCKKENENDINKMNFRKTLFYISIVCWCLFFIYGIFINFVYIMIGKRNIRVDRICIKLVFISIFNYSSITNFIIIYYYLYNSKL